MTGGRRAWEKLVRTLPWLVALTLALLLGMYAGGGSLYDGDEAVYAQFAREMRRSGDPVSLTWDGHAVHQRPPGYVWLLALSTGLLGESEGALRLVSVLATGITALLAGLLARRLCQWNAAEGEGGAASAAAAAGAATFGLLGVTWTFGRSVESDPLLALFVTAAAERWVASRMVTGAARRRRLAAFGALVGAACMVKQVVGLLPLALPMTAWLALPREGRPSLRERLALALAPVLAGLAVVLPWHALATLRYGADFWGTYMGFNVVARATRPVLAATPPWFYLRALVKLEGGPVALLLLAAILVLLVRAVRCRRAPDLVAVLPPLAGLLVFSVARSRVDYYLVVLMPLLAAQVAYLAASRGRAGLLALLAVVAALAGRGLPAPATLDRSPDVKRLAVAASGARVTVVGMQPSATRYYADRPVTRLVLDEETYRRLKTVDIFAVPGALALASGTVGMCSAPGLEGDGAVLVRDGPDADTLGRAGCLGPVLLRSGAYALHAPRP